ncbi:hypothetical protein [Gordonia sp. CPCC 205333]|uniref:hypothetical protein n=1 Tax=Gordonia sp. CPCC 205333 TaxID=3140790 RepID=UPI003AF36CD1
MTAAAMADEFEHGQITPAGTPEAGACAGVRLRDGRPVGRKSPGGNTPTTSVRLPASIRGRRDRQAGRAPKFRLKSTSFTRIHLTHRARWIRVDEVDLLAATPAAPSTVTP